MTADAGGLTSVPDLIVRKRSGGELSAKELGWLVESFVRGTVTDYQMSALAMAIYFKGMTDSETTALTLAMRDSGMVVDLSGVHGAKVDKHSTGGVGDKVSLCLAPLVAACGVRVPMVSGRGLGHTGGTLDKLESIPGFKVDMSVDRFVRQVADIGCALIGQTSEIAPADKRFYALRDVTGTVESIPLITASILSKKLAEGIDALVLDVKVGRGAFMKTIANARKLAKSIVRVGRLAGKRVTAILTTMEQPLGRAVGNALEAAEAFEVLRGGGPPDLVEVTLALGDEMVRLAGLARTQREARAVLVRAIADGSAARRMEQIIEAQGGDPRVVRDPKRLPAAPRTVKVRSLSAGFVRRIDALEIGLASMSLGAGRTRAEDDVDPAVGIVLEAKVGDRVEIGDKLATLHVREDAPDPEAARRVEAAIEIGARRPRERPLVLEVIRR